MDGQVKPRIVEAADGRHQPLVILDDELVAVQTGHVVNLDVDRSGVAHLGGADRVNRGRGLEVVDGDLFASALVDAKRQRIERYD